MAAPESSSMEEAIANMMRSILEEYCRKQTENINAKFDELTENIGEMINEQTEKLNNKLEQQSENFKQDTIKILRRQKN